MVAGSAGAGWGWAGAVSGGNAIHAGKGKVASGCPFLQNSRETWVAESTGICVFGGGGIG